MFNNKSKKFLYNVEKLSSRNKNGIQRDVKREREGEFWNYMYKCGILNYFTVIEIFYAFCACLML